MDGTVTQLQAWIGILIGTGTIGTLIWGFGYRMGRMIARLDSLDEKVDAGFERFDSEFESNRDFHETIARRVGVTETEVAVLKNTKRRAEQRINPT